MSLNHRLLRQQNPFAKPAVKEAYDKILDDEEPEQRTQTLLERFELTSAELAQLKKIESISNDGEVGVSWMNSFSSDKIGWMEEIIMGILFWTILWPFFLIGLILSPAIQGLANLQLKMHPKYKSFQSYKSALFQREKEKRDFWLKLPGHAFEHQLANLYQRLGYSANVTRGSGDGGVDIELTKGAKRLIVQCKQHSKPVGPAVVRELYGALISCGADEAILACTSGFTIGVIEFVKDKPINLIDVESIVQMQSKTNYELEADMLFS